MVNFNTEIVTVNLTNDLELQYNWAWNQDSCVRPNTEFDLPVLCQVNPDYGTNKNLTTRGKEYDAFKECCPNLKDAGLRQNQWISINVCATQFCFTMDNSTAKHFDECIYNAGNKLGDDLKLNDTERNTYRGRCEYINYDSLKKGVRYPVTNAAPVPRLLSFVLLATTLSGAFLAPSL
ncbi:hypothetical protein NPX13_g4534 [Xylaria arbuscula]|uniref:Uncharacterized protein n=1 Tax=Xylaria arbuscula TaxID=114810 RepID=A0A9W8NFA8_9PEZI|nr:hypothetical protein NPX13_g4534 [Xylaria arbuscula]